MSKYILLTATSFMYDNRYCRGRDTTSRLHNFGTRHICLYE